MEFTDPIEDVSHFVGQVSNIVSDWREKGKHPSEWQPWFRGEPDRSLKSALRPTLYRSLILSRTRQLGFEQELRLEFRRRGAQLLTERPSNPWEWYFLMQHYGVPTRLLDWTDGALFALYFAVKSGLAADAEAKKLYPVVYVLDPSWLNAYAFAALPVPKDQRSEGVALADWAEAENYLPDELESESLGPIYPLAIDPPHFARRVAAQGSRFVVFGRHRDGLRTLLRRRDSRLLEIPVDFRRLLQVRDELKTCGVSETSIFPDLDGLGRDLKVLWGGMCRQAMNEVLRSGAPKQP